MIISIILAITEIIGLFSIGIAASLTGHINENDVDRSSKLILDFLLPLFTFTSIVGGLDVNRFHELWILPFIGLFQVFFFAAAGMVLRFGLRGQYRDKQRTFMHLCAVNNSTFLPIIILRGIWGEAAIANLFLLYLGGAIGVWTVGVGLLGHTSVRQSIRGAIKPNLCAIFVALAAAFAGGKYFIPEVIMKILNSAGSIAVPLMLIMTGASLAQREIIRLTWPVVYITIVRLIILPLITIPILAVLSVSQDIYSVSAIVALMPTAISSVIMTRRYGGDSDYAASAALSTTLCSIATVPAAVWLLFGK